MDSLPFPNGVNIPGAQGWIDKAGVIGSATLMHGTERPAPLKPHRDLPNFYETARYYDRISGALSLGSCRAYRKWALRRAGLKPEMQLLDVATGTGLAAQAALDLGLSPSQIVGLDPSAGMLRENQKRRDIL